MNIPTANSKEFFVFQINFARQMQRVTHESLNFCLFNYTNIYRRFGLEDKPRNENNPTWKRFVSESGTHKDLGSVALSIRQEYENKKSPKEGSVCFSYEYNTDTKTVRLHFSNKDQEDGGPLNEIKIPRRLDELKQMFNEIKISHPEAEKVAGSSWLYNLNSYRRLFPIEYTKQLTTNPSGFNGMGIWGQFTDKSGNFKIEM